MRSTNVGGLSDTRNMNGMSTATSEDIANLDAIVSSLQAVEKTLQGVLAARDGLVALANRLAMSIAEQGDGIEDSDLTLRTVAAELATALCVSDRTVQRRMVAAEVMVERFPQVWHAQGAGLITAGHARVIVDAGAHIDDGDARAAYAVRVLEFAQHESPDGPDAMSELHVYGPSVLIHGAQDRLTQMAKAIAERGEDEPTQADDPRTLAQRRFDLAMDLLLTGAPAGHDTADRLLGSISAHVAVTVPVTTLMGADGPAAELSGRAPMDLASAQVLAGAASGWDRVLTHPVNGGVLCVDRYRPPESLRRRLRSRDERCRFPGCGMPARDSDLDHTRDAAFGGETSEDNLAALCRRHHVLKHQTPWHVVQHGDGLLEWTSPTGRTYVDRPPPPNTVTFIEPPF